MSTTDNAASVQNLARVMQIIVGAMAAGLVVFLAIVLVMERIDPPGGPDRAFILGLPMMTLLAVIFGFTCPLMSFVIPGLIADGGLKQLANRAPTAEPADDAAAIGQLFQTRLIIASALIEGAAFLALIAYMLEHHPVALGVAVALIAVLLSRIPTLDRVQGWMDEQTARLARLRRGDG